MEAAADLLPSITDLSGPGSVISEGPRWEIVVSPGVIRVRTRDYARAERTYERQPTARVVDRRGRLPAMLTLTYPGDWLTVAPDAETVKRHLPRSASATNAPGASR